MSRGPATLSGANKITVIGTGLVTVNANQLGNIDYLPAGTVTTQFRVVSADADDCAVPCDRGEDLHDDAVYGGAGRRRVPGCR